MAPPFKRANTSKDKDAKKRPIIVVKKRKAGPAPHHGGAWKVAYADFVTAMMAFFLLLWLLSTSSQATLEGIAEYFTPTAGIGEMRPIGVRNSVPSPMNAKEAGINMSSPGVMQAQAGATRSSPETPSPSEADEEDNLFERGAEAITQALQSTDELSEYRDNVAVGMTPDGLRIDIRDSDKYAMFELASPKLTEHGEAILTRLVPLLKRMPNHMSVSGYTDASILETQQVSRWRLSSERAESSLTFMLQAGLEPERPQRIVGMGDTQVLSANEPRSERNRRITVLMMRGSHILIPQGALLGNH